jgi:hypothetical protein
MVVTYLDHGEIKKNGKRGWHLIIFNILLISYLFNLTIRGNWWHTDQNGFCEDNRGRICVQGLVSYLDANEKTGGLCVIVGSHKQHTSICCRNPLAYREGDFLKISQDDPIMSIENEKRLVCCSAGDLILWDSRTIHCNTPGIEDVTTVINDDKEDITNAFNDDREENKNEIDQKQELIRICAYICMSPLSFANPKILNLRRQAFIYNISSSHWPYKTITTSRASSYYLPNNILTIGNDTFSSPTGSLTLEQRLLIDGNQSLLFGYDISNMCSIS